MQNYLVLFSLICLVACTGNKQGVFNTISSKDSDRAEMGLKIEYKTTRGQTIEDSLGVMYSLRYIPSSFTNQSEDPINIQISFSDNYDYPPVYNNDKFRIFPMPEVWAMDGIKLTDSIEQSLFNWIDMPRIHKILNPGEKWLIAFGTLYPYPINYGVFPVAVFSGRIKNMNHNCNDLIDKDVNNSIEDLSLVIGYSTGSQTAPESCNTIRIGNANHSNR